MLITVDDSFRRLVLNATLGSWADTLAAFGIAALAMCEGREASRGEPSIEAGMVQPPGLFWTVPTVRSPGCSPRRI